MSVFFFSYNLLLPTQVMGCLGILILLLFCFVGVHILRLAELGFAFSKKAKQPPAPPPEPQKTSPPKKEPVYYFVQKKPPR